MLTADHTVFRCALCDAIYESTLNCVAAWGQAESYGWRIDGDLVRQQTTRGEEIDGIVCWRHQPEDRRN
jgi:hypothetical protein